MNYQVSSAAMSMMSVALVAGLVIPVVLFLVLHLKWKYKAAPFWVGCGTFLLFAGVLERMLHSLVFGVMPWGSEILNNVWLYALYGALAAGVSEETGRFLAMKFVLKKYHQDDRNALMYGAGHGGFEALYVLGVGMISNLVMAFAINSGLLEAQLGGLSGELYDQVQAQVQALCNTPAWLFGVAILERLLAITGHICFSVIVWIAATRGGKLTLFYPLGIFLHFLLDFAVVIVNSYFGVAMAEVCTMVVVFVFVVVACVVYKRYCGERPLPAKEPPVQDARDASLGNGIS